MINPARLRPLKVNELIVISFTKTVSKYNTKILVKVEKSPSVKRLSGKLMRLNTGFRIKRINVRTIPPTKSVKSPFSICTPCTSLGSKYKEKV